MKTDRELGFGLIVNQLQFSVLALAFFQHSLVTAVWPAMLRHWPQLLLGIKCIQKSVKWKPA